MAFLCWCIVKTISLTHHLGNTFTGMDRNGRVELSSDQTVQAVHSCNSWLFLLDGTIAEDKREALDPVKLLYY